MHKLLRKCLKLCEHQESCSMELEQVDLIFLIDPTEQVEFH